MISIRVAFYLRASTGEQTTSNQRLELEAVAQARGWVVPGIYAARPAVVHFHGAGAWGAVIAHAALVGLDAGLGPGQRQPVHRHQILPAGEFAGAARQVA